MIEATTHASWASPRERSYERLAFVGDSILSEIVTLHLDRTFPRETFPPGVLTRIRAQVVADGNLRAVATAIGLDRIAVAHAPKGMGERAEEIVSAGKPLASMFEALIAACWRHHGAASTSEAVIAALLPSIESASDSPVELKSLLQERLARTGETVRYETIQSGGSEHAPEFTATVFREPSGEAIGSGTGGTKKAAESAAADGALALLGEREG